MGDKFLFICDGEKIHKYTREDIDLCEWEKAYTEQQNPETVD